MFVKGLKAGEVDFVEKTGNQIRFPLGNMVKILHFMLATEPVGVTAPVSKMPAHQKGKNIPV